MPQMAPLNWLSLFFMFIMIFIMFNMMNYFSFMYPKKFLSFMKKKKKLNNWKW